VSPLTLTLHQSPDHTVQVGDTVFVDGDPFVIRDVKPQRESGVFLDWGQNVRANVVVVTVERFDGYPA
jgi:hypothetical protein